MKTKKTGRKSPSITQLAIMTLLSSAATLCIIIIFGEPEDGVSILTALLVKLAAMATLGIDVILFRKAAAKDLLPESFCHVTEEEKEV